MGSISSLGSVVMMVKVSTFLPSGLRHTSHNPAKAKGSLDSYSVQSENLFLTYSCCQKVYNFLNGIIRSAICGFEFAAYSECYVLSLLDALPIYRLKHLPTE